MDIAPVIKWMDAGSKLIGHPLPRLLIPLIAGLIPTGKVTPEDIGKMKEHYKELDRREKDAIERASRG